MIAGPFPIKVVASFAALAVATVAVLVLRWANDAMPPRDRRENS